MKAKGELETMPKTTMSLEDRGSKRERDWSSRQGGDSGLCMPRCRTWVSLWNLLLPKLMYVHLLGTCGWLEPIEKHK